MSGTNNSCAFCHSSARLRCAGCTSVYYCSKEHQRQDWPKHRNVCRAYKVVRTSQNAQAQYVIASRDIKAGEVIFSELPLVIAPRYYLASLTCVGCCRSLNADSNVCCLRCGWPACRPDCPGLTDETRHGAECDFLRVVKEVTKHWSMEALMPLRLLLLQTRNPEKWKILLEMALPATKQTSDDEDLLSKLGDGVKYLEIILDFLSRASPQRRLQPPFETAKDIFSFLVAKAKTILSVKSRPLAAIYPVASILDHSCMPNTRLHYELFQDVDTSGAKTDSWRGRVTARATKNISKGDRVTAQFFEEFFMCTLERQKRLFALRNTRCMCARCLDPSELGVHFGTLKCTYCSGWVLPAIPAAIKNTRWKCIQCGRYLDAKRITEIIWLKTFLGKNPAPKVQETEWLLRLRDPIVHPQNFLVVLLKFHLCKTLGSEPGEGINEICLEKLEKKSALGQELLMVLQNPALSMDEGFTARTFLEKGRADAEILKLNYLFGKWNRNRVESAIAECRSLFQRVFRIMPDYHQDHDVLCGAALWEQASLTMWATDHRLKIAD